MTQDLLTTLMQTNINDISGLRIVPWYDCNLRCSFCYQKTFKSAHMDLTQLKKHLFDIKNIHVPIQYITIAGGEIAMYPEETYQIIKEIRAIYPFIKISITSNGTGSIDFYKRLLELAIDNITISMNNPIQKVQDTVAELSTMHQFSLRLNSVLNADKIEDCKTTLKFAKKHNLRITFCEDFLNPGYEDLLMFLKKSEMISDHAKIEKKQNSFVITDFGFSFWIWNKDFKENPSSLFLTPSGEATIYIDDILNSEGAGNVI